MNYDWPHMTADEWIKAVGGVLLIVMVYLLKKAFDNYGETIKVIKSEHAEDREDSEKYRELIRIELAQYRTDHRNDMNALFENAREDRRAQQSTMKELTAAIRSLQGQVDKRLWTGQPGSPA